MSSRCPVLGFQLLVERSTCDLTGANAPYVFALQYVSRQPPDDRPQVVDVNRTMTWPDTLGSLERLAIAFNAVVRIGRPERINLTLSGGPTFHRVAGRMIRWRSRPSTWADTRSCSWKKSSGLGVGARPWPRV